MFRHYAVRYKLPHSTALPALMPTLQLKPSMKNRSSLFLGASLCLLSNGAYAESSAAANSTPSPSESSTESSTSKSKDASNSADTEDGSDSKSATGADNASGTNIDEKGANAAVRTSEKTGATDADAKATAHPEGEQNDDDADEEETLDGDGGSIKNGGAPKVAAGRFRMMLQLRYKHTYADPGKLSVSPTISHEQVATVKEQDGYDIQRAFLRYTARPIKQVEAKLLVDFAELKHNNVKQSFKLAYLQIHPTKRIQFDVGLLKRTYSLLELLPIVEHELADLGPTDSYIKDQGYAGRDIGAVVRVQPLPERRWLTVSVGAFRGDIDEGYDANPVRLVTARLESLPWKHLRLGVNGSFRTAANRQMQKFEDADGNKYYAEATTLDKGNAFGGDVSLLFKHLQVRLEGLYGDRTDIGRINSNKFMSGWIVVAPNFKVGSVKFVPAAKLEVLDTQPQSSGGRRIVGTAVFGVFPYKNLRLLVDVTRTMVDDLTPAMSNVPWTSGNNTVYVFEPSNTSGTLQLQYQF